MAQRREITAPEYQALAEFRYHIRRYLHFSEQAAREAGMEPQQYQLLLAVKGLPDGTRPTIREVAERLQIQHHSTVELVDRLVAHGFVQRQRGDGDRREVLLQMTPKGEKVLRELVVHHQAQLRTAIPMLVTSLKRLASAGRARAGGGTRKNPPGRK